MKKLLLMLLLASTIDCSDRNTSGSSESCTYNGHILYTGEKGGCYYLSSGGNKEYVDRSYCSGCN